MISILKSCCLFPVIILLVLAKTQWVAGDESFVVDLMKNQSILVLWTVNNTEEQSHHVLRCKASNDPKAKLYWTLDLSLLQEYKGDENIKVDVANPQDITMKFSHIDYSVIKDYYCVDVNDNNELLSYTYFKVLVKASTSKTSVVIAIVFLLLFMVGAYFTCKITKVNENSTRINL